jgi:2-alkenal reductase
MAWPLLSEPPPLDTGENAMRVGLIAGLCALCLGWPGSAVATPLTGCSAAGPDADPTVLFETVAPAVVAIEGAGGGVRVFGAGFLWDRAGHVVTNEHVVHPSSQLILRFADGGAVRPRIVGTAPELDIAVLRIDPPPVAVPVALGDSRRLKVGQNVFAIGNPYGVGVGLSRGIVSGLNRPLDLGDGRRVGGAIQTDANLNPGNSGGPLLDGRGCLVGMTTAMMAAKAAGPGIGFALPAELLQRTVADLIGPEPPEPPDLGLLAANTISGVLVTEVFPGSRAAAMGASPGDVITHANGRPILDVIDFTRAVRHSADTGLRLTLQRGGSTRTVEVMLASTPGR